MPSGTFVRHLVITVGGNAGALAIFAILLRHGLTTNVSLAVIYGIGYVVSFVLQRHWNWRSSGNFYSQALGYLVVYAAFLFVNTAAIRACSGLCINAVLLQAVLVCALTPLMHFTLGRVVFWSSR